MDIFVKQSVWKFLDAFKYADNSDISDMYL